MILRLVFNTLTTATRPFTVAKTTLLQILMSALNAMQEKNRHLENSLSAETRIKLDLFSALGEAKRQLDIVQSERFLLIDT